MEFWDSNYYVRKDLLKEGTADNRFIEFYLNNSKEIVPASFYNSLYLISNSNYLTELDNYSDQLE